MDITGELAGPWRIQKKLRDSKQQNSKQLFDLGGHELCMHYVCISAASQARFANEKSRVGNSISWETLVIYKNLKIMFT